jgi:hypothetical protein
MQEYVSVQLNNEILFRETFEETMVTEGSVIEFLYYMGGGSVDPVQRKILGAPLNRRIECPQTKETYADKRS